MFYEIGVTKTTKRKEEERMMSWFFGIWNAILHHGTANDVCVELQSRRNSTSTNQPQRTTPRTSKSDSGFQIPFQSSPTKNAPHARVLFVRGAASADDGGEKEGGSLSRLKEKRSSRAITLVKSSSIRSS